FAAADRRPRQAYQARRQAPRRNAGRGGRSRSAGYDDSPQGPDPHCGPDVPACALSLQIKRLVVRAWPPRQQRTIGLPPRVSRIAEAVGDRIAAVAAEVLQRHLHPRRGLAALVFGEVEHALDLHHGIAIKPGLDDLGDRLLALDQALQDAVELI